MAEQIVIILEDAPDKNKLPVAHIETLQDAKEFGDRPPKRGKTPMATALVREGLHAYATNIQLVKKARELKLSDDVSFTGIIKTALQTAIRFRLYQQKKTEEAGAEQDNKGNGRKPTVRKQKHTTRKG